MKNKKIDVSYDCRMAELRAGILHLQKQDCATNDKLSFPRFIEWRNEGNLFLIVSFIHRYNHTIIKWNLVKNKIEKANVLFTYPHILPSFHSIELISHLQLKVDVSKICSDLMLDHEYWTFGRGLTWDPLWDQIKHFRNINNRYSLVTQKLRGMKVPWPG